MLEQPQVTSQPPTRVLVAGATGVIGRPLSTQRGASNANARRELGWTPTYASWRDGLAAGNA